MLLEVLNSLENYTFLFEFLILANNDKIYLVVLINFAFFVNKFSVIPNFRLCLPEIQIEQ